MDIASPMIGNGVDGGVSTNKCYSVGPSYIKGGGNCLKKFTKDPLSAFNPPHPTAKTENDCNW